MRKIIAAVILCLTAINCVKSQSLSVDAENIRREYKIPELAYAVVSSDSILEMNVSGFKRINSKFRAELTDRFHLGSNTKAITGFIAALLVKQGKIDWNTKFFELFPELKAASRRDYDEMTLQDLLTFRAKLPPYTYTNPLPKKRWFKGDYARQRFALVKWFLKQKPNESNETLKLTNLGYIAAGLMLEKASGKSYKELVKDLGERLDIDFDFDYPNLRDKTQTWGHDANLNPLPPKDNYKLNWLLAAGNVNVSLPQYAKFIQIQLRGLNGKSDLLTKAEFSFLHYGSPEFSVGWFWKTVDENRRVSYNTGNAGAFITEVEVGGDADRAYLIFANSAGVKTADGIKVLLDKMIERYGK